MKNIEFNYVKEVALEKSFSKASKKLGISQPALSNYINKLEKQLGVLLFDRSISPIEITEFGQCYLDYAEEVLAATDKFESIKSDLMNLKAGNITVGSTSCFSTTFLPMIIGEFHNRYKGIGIDIVEGKVSEIMERCFEGNIDMFFADYDIDSDLFAKEELFTEQLLMAVPIDDPINEKLKEFVIPTEEIVAGNAKSPKYKSVDISVVKDKEFILLNEDQHIRRIVDKVFQQAGINPNVTMEVPQTTTGLAFTVENVGISFVAESTIKFNNINKHPCYYKIGDSETTSRKMCIAYKMNKYISKAHRQLIQIMKDNLQV